MAANHSAHASCEPFRRADAKTASRPHTRWAQAVAIAEQMKRLDAEQARLRAAMSSRGGSSRHRHGSGGAAMGTVTQSAGSLQALSSMSAAASSASAGGRDGVGAGEEEEEEGGDSTANAGGGGAGPAVATKKQRRRPARHVSEPFPPHQLPFFNLPEVVREAAEEQAQHGGTPSQ